MMVVGVQQWDGLDGTGLLSGTSSMCSVYDSALPPLSPQCDAHAPEVTAELGFWEIHVSEETFCFRKTFVLNSLPKRYFSSLLKPRGSTEKAKVMQ